MHIQEDSLHGFCILQLIYKENRTDGFFQNQTETEPNPCFSQNQTKLEKSIPHIPNRNSYTADMTMTDLSREHDTSMNDAR